MKGKQVISIITDIVREEKINRIVSITSTLTGISEEDIKGDNAKIPCVDARRIACFVIVKGKIAKLQKTADYFGKKHPNIIFYLKTIYLVDSKLLEKVCNACSSFVDINLHEYKDLVKIEPVKNYHEFKYFDLIFKNNKP